MCMVWLVVWLCDVQLVGVLKCGVVCSVVCCVGGLDDCVEWLACQQLRHWIEAVCLRRSVGVSSQQWGLLLKAEPVIAHSLVSCIQYKLQKIASPAALATRLLVGRGNGTAQPTIYNSSNRPTLRTDHHQALDRHTNR